MSRPVSALPPLLAVFDRMVDRAFLRQEHRKLVLVERDPSTLLERFEGYEPPKGMRDRIDDFSLGDYGRCGHCASMIPFERLKIRPLARYCIDCQEMAEKGMLEES